jgi:tRNA A-37 threonylcarbamoyl transferase component Bud32
MPLCKGHTILGNPCLRTVKGAKDFCFLHEDQNTMQKILKKDINESIKKGEVVGKGEQGITYAFSSDLVVKVTCLVDKKAESSWLNEASIGQELGRLKIAPKVIRYFVSGKSGIILMERLKTLKSHKIKLKKKVMDLIRKNTPDIVRYQLAKEDIDDLRNIPSKDQLGFISVLEKMIDHGYIHMDNHVENIGYIKNRPVVFDFGFTQKRNKLNKRWALCFSIFQILEYCPVNILEQTQFYRVATACINNTYIWGHPESGKVIPLKDLQNNEELIPFMKRVTKDSLNDISPDLKAGSLVYAKLIVQENRHGGSFKDLLDFIYIIRDPAYHKNVSKNVLDIIRQI